MYQDCFVGRSARYQFTERWLRFQKCWPLLFLVLPCLLLANGSQAAWRLKDNRKAVIAYHDLAFYGKSSFGLATGDNYTVLRTTDAGATWNLVPMDALRRKYYGGGFETIQYLNLKEIVVKGRGAIQFDTINTFNPYTVLPFYLVSSNGGDSWTVHQLPNATSGIWAIDSSHVWACIDSGSVASTTDAGLTWKKHRLSNSYIANASHIEFFDSLHAVVVGDSVGLFYSIDGGASWNRSITDFSSCKTVGIQSVDIVDKKSAILLTRNCDGNMYVLHSSNQGATWNQVFTTASGGGAIVVRDSASATLMLDEGLVYTTSDGFVTWDFQGLYAGGFAGSHDVRYAMSKDGTIWGPTAYGTLTYSTDSAQTWKLLDPFPQTAIHAVTELSSDRTLLIGDFPHRVMESTDLARTWKDIGSSDISLFRDNQASFEDVQASDSLNLTGRLIVASNVIGRKFVWNAVRSTNSGNTWTLNPEIPAYYWRAIYYDSQTIWCFTNDSLATYASPSEDSVVFSSDAGKNWRFQFLRERANSGEARMTFEDSIHIWMFDGGTHYYHSTDRGAHWSKRNLPWTGTLQHYDQTKPTPASCFINSTMGMMVIGFSDSTTNTYAVWSTTDDGGTWKKITELEQNAFVNYSSTKLELTAKGKFVWALLGGQNIWQSTNYGATWKLAELPPQIFNFQLTGGLLPVNDSTIWCYGNLGVIIEDVVPQSSSSVRTYYVKNAPWLPPVHFQVTASPNPFSHSTILTISLPTADKVTVALFDEVGRLVWNGVQDQVLDQGTNLIEVSPTGLSEGMYFCTVRTRHEFSAFPVTIHP